MKCAAELKCACLGIVVTIAGITVRADAQAAFHHLQGGKINKVVFIDSDKGWTVEDGGRIRFTTDGGETWAFATVPDEIRADLYDIFFLDGNMNTAWVVGDQGIVLKAVASTNAQQWTEVTSSSPDTRIKDALEIGSVACHDHPAKLQGIFMTDSTHGWAIGYDGAIAKTSNGWTTWTRPSSGLPSQWSCSDAPDGPDDLYDIHLFKDPSASTHYQRGIICGDDRSYYLTTDGGATWSWNSIGDTCPDNHYIELWRMTFADPEDPSSAGWLAGGAGTGAGYLFSTGDGGQTWAQQTCFDVLDPSFEAGNGCDFSTMYDVATIGGSAQPWGITAGYAGQLFVRQNTGGSVAGNVDACGNSGCASSCTSSGQIWLEKDTTNFGENHCDQKPPFFGVCRISDTRGCAVGMFGRIVTLESGATNEIVDRATTYFGRLTDAVFSDSNYGLAIGQEYQIYLTADGGEAWRNVSNWDCGGETAVGTGIDLSPSGTYGVAVGNAGFVAFSSNGGDSWTQLTSHSVSAGIPAGLPDLNAVAFVPGSGSATAYAVGGSAVGGSGAVIKSTDSGAHWASVAAAGSYALNGLSFIDSSHGYVVGVNGKVYATTTGGTGGSAWTVVSVSGSPTTNFNDIAAWGSWGTNGAAAIIVGDNGKIYEKSASDRGFSPVTTGLGQTGNLYDVEVLSSGTNVRIGGDFGVALFRDSGTWSSPKTWTSFQIYKMAFQSATSGKAIGRDFIVLDYN